MLKFWYLNHSGFMVETDSHILVFDYYTDTPHGGTPDQGVVTPALLPQDKQLCVFVSHSHFDHYNKVVHSWQTARPQSLIFLGDGIPTHEGCITVPSGETCTLPTIEVTALRSTDQGAAFLVKVDGKVIYHAGDLNWWHWDGEADSFNDGVSAAYRSETDKLVGEKIDIAFVPVDPRLERAAFWGGQYFMKTVGAKVFVPMHLWDDYTVCNKFAQDSDSQAFRDRVILVTHRGQSVTL